MNKHWWKLVTVTLLLLGLLACNSDSAAPNSLTLEEARALADRSTIDLANAEDVNYTFEAVPTEGDALNGELSAQTSVIVDQETFKFTVFEGELTLQDDSVLATSGIIVNTTMFIFASSDALYLTGSGEVAAKGSVSGTFGSSLGEGNWTAVPLGEPAPMPDEPDAPQPGPQPELPEETPEEVPEEAPVGNDAQPTLLSRYNATVSTLLAGEVSNYEMEYRPRQFKAGLALEDVTVENAASYEGWDLLTTPINPAFFGGTGGNFGGLAEGAPWLELTLTRSAQVGVAWPAAGTAPSWLNSWTKGETVSVNGTQHQVYEKAFSAGETALEAPPGDTNYLVLIAEADGTASAAPAVPAGLETPQPNQACPSWVHDQYRSEGPDGRFYASWHPQIDPVYACSFGHEHGSDPSLLPGDHTTIFGYVAAKVPQLESNEGFKNFAIEAEDGNWWLFTVHGQTSDTRRYCTQLHTVKVKLVSPEGELLADLQYKGDYGASRDEAGNVLQIPGCDVNQAEIAERSPNTVKAFPTADTQGNGIEQWLTHVPEPSFGFADTGNSLGFSSLSFDMYYINPAKICTDASCTEFVTKSSGEKRYIIPISGFSINADNADATGTFYTDPYGNELRSGDESDAVAQYLKPGTNVDFQDDIGFGATCVADDAFRMEYNCAADATRPFDATPDMNLGNGLSNN